MLFRWQSQSLVGIPQGAGPELKKMPKATSTASAGGGHTCPLLLRMLPGRPSLPPGALEENKATFRNTRSQNQLVKLHEPEKLKIQTLPQVPDSCEELSYKAPGHPGDENA